MTLDWLNISIITVCIIIVGYFAKRFITNFDSITKTILDRLESIKQSSTESFLVAMSKELDKHGDWLEGHEMKLSNHELQIEKIHTLHNINHGDQIK